MKIIELRDVTIRYGDVVAVQDANLDIYSDDFIGIIGPNGGGKTSLVKAILGLTTYEGKVIYHSVYQDRRAIGYLPQINRFDKDFPISVREVVLSGLQRSRTLRKRVKSQEAEKCEELLSMMRISELAGKPIGEISGGQMQRALLCRALISEPELLILDEPTNFIDSKFETELFDILKQLNHKMAIIMVSHDLSTLSDVIKSIVCVNRTVHRHDTNLLTPHIMEEYNCPVRR